MPGEFDFIDWIKRQQRINDLVQLPAGDDLAILKWTSDDLLLVGVDQVLDGVHFDSKVHPPEAIGRKVMNRNLSDCAAMGCLPAAALVTIAAPRGTGADYLKRLYQGIHDAAKAHGCEIVGGDTGSWDGKLVVTVSIVGRSAGVEPVRRCGAKPGDVVYVTGPLGGSLRGRHMTFEPRVRLGRSLASSRAASAMLDLSDGLSRDARHIAEQSHVQIVVDGARIPVHADVMGDPAARLDHALNDGEDYELLFTGARGLPHIAIGEVRAGSGVWILLNGETLPLQPKGWEHTL